MGWGGWGGWGGKYPIRNQQQRGSTFRVLFLFFPHAYDFFHRIESNRSQPPCGFDRTLPHSRPPTVQSNAPSIHSIRHHPITALAMTPRPILRVLRRRPSRSHPPTFNPGSKLCVWRHWSPLRLCHFVRPSTLHTLQADSPGIEAVMGGGGRGCVLGKVTQDRKDVFKSRGTTSLCVCPSRQTSQLEPPRASTHARTRGRRTGRGIDAAAAVVDWAGRLALWHANRLCGAANHGARLAAARRRSTIGLLLGGAARLGWGWRK